MTTRIVGGTIVGPNGLLLSSVPIEIELVLAEGFVVTGQYSLAGKLKLQSDPNGAWQTPLECNDDITPVGTLYQVTEKIPSQYGGSKTYLIQVLTGLSGGVNQVLGLIVPAAVPVGGTYQAVTVQGTGAPGYIVVANNTALNAINPKVEGQPVWVTATDVWWAWNGAFYEVLNHPRFGNQASADTAFNDVAQHKSQPYYRQTNGVDEGPYWRNSNNSYTKPWHLPWGQIAHAEITANSATFTAVADVANLALVFTHYANRHILVEWSGLVQSSVAADFIAMTVCKGDNTQLQQASTYIPLANVSTQSSCWVRIAGTGSSQTIKMRGARVLGTGNGLVLGNASFPAAIRAFDIGPSGAPV